MAKATIAGLAAAKGLPAGFVAQVATEDERGVVFAYKDLDGSKARSHVRHELEKSQPSTWAYDAKKIVPLGSHLIVEYRRRNVPILALPEGDTDTTTCHHHEIPAIGLPGTTMYKLLTLAHVEAFAEVLLAVDSDERGEAAVLEHRDGAERAKAAAAGDWLREHLAKGEQRAVFIFAVFQREPTRAGRRQYPAAPAAAALRLCPRA